MTTTTQHAIGMFCWSELATTDQEGAKKFYPALFGWTFEQGPSGGGFGILTEKVAGGMHGGDPRGGTYLFFRVDDMDAALTRVRELGGTVEAMDVEGDTDAVLAYGGGRAQFPKFHGRRQVDQCPRPSRRLLSHSIRAQQ